MNLIQLGDFTLNSGKKSTWKLECDDFIRENLDGLAELIRQLVGPFHAVEGVPRGGVPLAEALQPFIWKDGRGDYLIVDDVLTTGGSMDRARKAWSQRTGWDEGRARGAVVFARGPLPPWIKAVFPMPQCFWTV